MKVQELKEIINDYIVASHNFSIQRNIFQANNGRKVYNETIRENVQPNSFGIYIWSNHESDEVVYIGMAGKIKTNGAFCDHTLRDRLTASRGKDKLTNKDIQTNDYIKNFMEANKIEAIDFYIFYTKEGEPPSYLEAILLYNFYKKNNRLPQLNNAF